MITLKDLQIQNKNHEYNEQLIRLFPEEFKENMVHTVTFQVTEQCNLHCTYCYQIDKHNTYMPIEVGKQGIDMLLASTPENNTYINPEKSPGIIIDFIGGEPLLAIDTIIELIEYFKQRTIELQHPWANRHRFSICSNGLLYFDPKFQELLTKYGNEISFSISIDGIKELHDMCRLQPNGEGSYDIAIAGVKDYIERGLGHMGSKMTLAPENIIWTSKAIQNLVELGYDDINLNCIFEKGWTLKDANKLYYQLKDAANYLIENRRYLDTKVSIFDMNIGKPMSEEDNKNWCWGAGTPILTDKGYKNIEDIKIGDLVYTHDGTLQPVIDLKSHYAENTVNLKCSGVFDLVATDNHKIFTKPFEYRGNKGKKHYKDIQKTELKNIQHNDLIKLFNNPRALEKDFPTDLAYLIGRFIGDGYTTTQNGKNIVCAFDEKNKLKEYFDKANIEYSIYDNKTVKEFHIIKGSSKKENILLNDILANCGIGAENKHLPAEVFYWNEEAQYALLKGYLDADGSINKREQTRFNTVSYRLAQEMMVLLRILGYNPTCYKNNRGGKSTIQGREVNIKDRYEVYYFEDTSRTKYVHHDENNDCWTYGLEITPAEPQMVYNLTVANNHSYVAGGIISSNCGGTGAMLAIDYKGDIYPCLRYMESSVGPNVPKLIIGNVWDGIGIQKEEQQRIKCLECITRRSQSTDECFNCPIAAGCAWCFPAGTKINTPTGLKNIEDLKIGDKVIDKDGNSQIVENNLSRIASSDLIYLKAAGLKDILTTKEHPFYAKKVIKKVHNLPVYGEPKWIPAGELKTTDKIGIFIPKSGNKDIDKNFAYVIGRYVGDGWKTSSNRIAHPYRYYICTAFDEQKDFEKKLDLSGIKYSKHENRTVEEYNLNISNNEYLVSLLEDCGRKANDKHVPEEVWNWNKESIQAFLKGYFDADGSISEQKGQITQRFTSISYELILNIAELVRMVYHKNVNITERHPHSTAIIEERKVNQSISYEGRFIVGEPKRRYYEYDEKNNIMWINVSKSSKKCPKEEIVYNLTISNTHSFIANGAIVHNCSAYNYQEFGTADHRATYICPMHKARVLANVYYWNSIFRKEGMGERFKNWIPEEWALEIIDKDELDMLNKLAELN